MREMGRMEIEQENNNMENNLNETNDNRTNQNNEEHIDKSSEYASMILQSDELPLNHNIVIKKLKMVYVMFVARNWTLVQPYEWMIPKIVTLSLPLNVQYGILLVTENQPLH